MTMDVSQSLLSHEAQSVLQKELQNLYHRRSAISRLINSLEDYGNLQGKAERNGDG